jgi:hypothetical protein
MEDFSTKKKPELSQSSKIKTSKSSYQQLPWEWDWISNILIASFILTWLNPLSHMFSKLVVQVEDKTELIAIYSWIKVTF